MQRLSGDADEHVHHDRAHAAQHYPQRGARGRGQPRCGHGPHEWNSAGGLVPGSVERHGQDEGGHFYTWVFLADAGVRYVIKANPDPGQVVKSIIELRAGAELAMRSEIDTTAVCKIPHRCSGREDPPLGEIDVEPEAAIAIKGPFACSHYANKRRYNPQHIVKAVFTQHEAGRPRTRLLAVRQ